jgi:ferredoxin-NADP reductase
MGARKSARDIWPVMTETPPQQWAGERGYIDKHLLMRYVTDVTAPLYYLSGPVTMVAAMRQILTKAHGHAEQIRTEAFSGYYTYTSPDETRL